MPGVVSAVYPFACCGHAVFKREPGSYASCPICHWEDDIVQLRWPDYVGGANRPSLVECQRNYRDGGAKEPRCKSRVREATADEPIEKEWRPIDPVLDRFEPRGVKEFGALGEDLTVLYWWRPSF